MADALPMVFVIAAGLCLSLVLLALWHSLRGLLVRGGGPVGSAPRIANRERLLHEKQELLTAIRDVRQEHDLGKVSDADFARLEQGYRARAREVLRELEEQLSPYRASAEQLIEKALGGALPATSSAVASPAVEAPPVLASGVCSRCKTSNDRDAVFCKKCGERISREAAP